MAPGHHGSQESCCAVPEAWSPPSGVQPLTHPGEEKSGTTREGINWASSPLRASQHLWMVTEISSPPLRHDSQSSPSRLDTVASQHLGPLIQSDVFSLQLRWMNSS